MSVLLTFGVPSDSFALGRALTGVDGVRVRLERIVPTDTTVVPFFWAEADGRALASFEDTVLESPLIDSVTALDRFEDEALYRATWAEPPASLLDWLVEADGTILTAAGTVDTWTFHVRFADHADVGRFRSSVGDVPLRVDRVSEPTNDGWGGPAIDVTDEQRLALRIAVEEGYFDVPRRIDLGGVAERLGISRQAASERIRRGTDSVLRSVLFDG